MNNNENDKESDVDPWVRGKFIEHFWIGGAENMEWDRNRNVGKENKNPVETENSTETSQKKTKKRVKVKKHSKSESKSKTNDDDEVSDEFDAILDVTPNDHH